MRKQAWRPKNGSILKSQSSHVSPIPPPLGGGRQTGDRRGRRSAFSLKAGERNRRYRLVGHETKRGPAGCRACFGETKPGRYGPARNGQNRIFAPKNRASWLLVFRGVASKPRPNRCQVSGVVISYSPVARRLFMLSLLVSFFQLFLLTWEAPSVQYIRKHVSLLRRGGAGLCSAPTFEPAGSLKGRSMRVLKAILWGLAAGARCLWWPEGRRVWP